MGWKAEGERGMTKEPVYYCERCEKVLEKKDQGKYTWCEDCRWTWTDGFNAGFKAHTRIMDDPCALLDILKEMDEYLPYVVKE